MSDSDFVLSFTSRWQAQAVSWWTSSLIPTNRTVVLSRFANFLSCSVDLANSIEKCAAKLVCFEGLSSCVLGVVFCLVFFVFCKV